MLQDKSCPISKMVELHWIIAINASAHEEGGSNAPVGKLEAE